MKLKTKIYFLTLFCTIMLSGCKSSTKGKWSDADKQKFREDMNAVEELSNFGENKSKWIECYLSKCEANYTSYKASNQDEKGTEKLGFECVREVFSSFKNK
jgi:hypothetical protein